MDNVKIWLQVAVRDPEQRAAILAAYQRRAARPGALSPCLSPLLAQR